MHYQRLTKSGYLEQPLSTGPDEARFWAKVNKDGPLSEHRPELGPCWLWTAGISANTGYGNIWWDNTTQSAHRIAYELTTGTIPAGLTIDHLCRRRACVNPSHLEPVTHRVNNNRGTSRSALNSRKTHCVNGHEFTPENTYIHPKRGTRACKTCAKLRSAEYYLRLQQPQ